MYDIFFGATSQKNPLYRRCEGFFVMQTEPDPSDRYYVTKMIDKQKVVEEISHGKDME